jgi:hypothetical protein
MLSRKSSGKKGLVEPGAQLIGMMSARRSPGLLVYD